MREKLTLKQARKRRGLNQAEVAEILGVTSASICHWERGERVPKVTTFLRMCELYKCKPSDIIFTQKVKTDITA